MINEKEIESVSLSPTKKDFYQIYNELLETAGKISDRWDPAATNESDPGIVLLKLLSAIADKLNYNIDKNTLECFLPSATQQESMRKLCDMLGYSVKYYRSATTTATVSYTGEWPEATSEKDYSEISLDKFTALQDDDEEIHYLTLDKVTLTNENRAATVDCIEGQLCTCENNGNSNNLITLAQLDSNLRYYLPESQIAENGIFINDSVINSTEGTATISYNADWTAVENLNTVELNQRYYKFCFDSIKGLPYIQFPNDVSNLINDGFLIRYIRTNGINGNIAVKKLSSVAQPSNFDTNLSIDNFKATNNSAAVNGKNLETINEAYNSYKKTIGTFDTLVTCRDYMNKIYQLTESDTDTTPLVSNIIVSDIRDDINRAFTLCEFSDYGIKYVDKTIQSETTDTEITNFDIMLYPFATIASSITESTFNRSFKYTNEKATEIENDLSNYKTISHTLKYPKTTEIVCIKNYLKLNAKITTINKVNATEESSILASIYSNIYQNFMARKLDFGEMIPFDEILACIENADSRIKNVSLDEPILYTVFETGDGEEYGIENTLDDTKKAKAKELYNKLAMRNILAGKIALFNYNEDFKYEYSESKYTTANTDENAEYEPLYPTGNNKLVKMASECVISECAGPITLADNEIIQFRAPAYKTSCTYPAYVNYYISLKQKTDEDAITASFITLYNFMLSSVTSTTDHWDKLREKIGNLTAKQNITSADIFNTYLKDYGALWTRSGSASSYTYTRIKQWTATKDYYYIDVKNTQTFPVIYEYIIGLSLPATVGNEKYSGVYRSLGWNSTNVPGYLVDNTKVKYHICTTALTTATPLTDYYVQYPYEYTSGKYNNGLGVDLKASGIPKDCEYELGEDEFLLINYTEASTDDSEDSGDVYNIVYEKGTIIKPNFILTDSFVNNQQLKKSFAKTSGFNFTQLDGTAGKNGMYALGSNEQIEIRKKAELVLGKVEGKTAETTKFVNMNIYWDLLNEDKLLKADGTTGFPWETVGTGSQAIKCYTLKSGEYFYFTDSEKLDMSYYGSGTQIIQKGSINIDKPAQITNETLSADEILANGINSIPWWKISSTNEKNITFKEYQYINLVNGDKLIEVSNNTTSNMIMPINNTPIKCTSASYKLQDSSTTETLTKISVGDDSWEVRSLLQFNMGPELVQTLRAANNTEQKIIDRMYLYYNTVGKTTYDQIIEPIDQISVSLKSNYLCQTATDTADVRVSTESVLTGEIEWINDFKLKVFKYSPVSIITEGTESPISVENFGEHWTKIAMSEFKATSKTELRVNLPTTNSYGLVMMYVIADESESASGTIKLPYITFTASSTSASSLPVIFNYYTSNTESWWPNYKDSSNNYYLRHGLNIVKIGTSGTITLHPDSKLTATIILGNLDIIDNKDHGSGDYDAGINLDVLGYYYTATGLDSYANRASELLKNIRDNYDTCSIINNKPIGHNFYYNTILENSECLDINTKLDINNMPIETLASPNIWYDYNNVNNKFVISQIDTKYMKNYGISIAKSSKRTY